MGLDFQTLLQKVQSIISDVELQTGQTISSLAQEWDRIWAVGLAGASKTFDRGVGVAFRDVFLSTTQDDKVLAEYEGWTKTTRQQATQALLHAQGTGTPSQVIGGGTSGATYVSDDGQKFYFPTDITVSAGGVVDEDIRAFIAGAQANLASGELAITAQNPDISDILTITAITNEGEDIEDLETWRNQMKRSAQQPPLSDNYSFYFTTARQVEDVAAGYPYVGRPSQLDLYIEKKVKAAIPTVGARIPDSTILTNVLEHFNGDADGTVRLPLDYFGNLPDDATTKRFNTLPVFETGFTVRVSDLDPDNDENKADIKLAIDTFFAERRPFVKGTSVENNSTISQKALNAVVQNVAEANNMDDFGDVQFSLDTLWLPIESTYSLTKGELTTVTVEFP